MKLYFAAIVLSLLASTASAFCFYSTLEENDLKVIQHDNYGGSYWEKFDATIEPGGMSCCNYQNKHCNGAETRDAVTAFRIWINVSQAKHAGTQDVHLPSGGYARIGGSPRNPDIQVFDAYDNPFHYTGPPIEEFSH